ncbi:MAG: hypothetical protein RIS20_122 [Bacteroidota bacterium]|jgi:hypothetical protein
MFTLLLVLNISTSHCFSQAIDYSQYQNWAVLPGAYPNGLQSKVSDSSLWKDVDVFYVYPTLMLDKKDKRWNVELSDQDQQQKVLESAVKYQASAWAEAGKMYVPFYRQAHIRSYYQLEEGGREALLFAYEDVKNAFQYYLEHYNHGRPIILAGHSQGSTHLRMILRDFFDNKPLQKQLVAAYIPGIGMEKTEFSTIPLMNNPKQTGGFVTWNTFKKNIDEDTYIRWYKGKAVVNPVTWNTQGSASKEQHQGFLYSNDQTYCHCFETHVIDGALWISRPCSYLGLVSWTMKNLHVGDVNLFWKDINENAKLRARTYLSEKGS